MSETLTVKAGFPSYPVFVGRLAPAQVRSIAAENGERRLFLITDKNVWTHWEDEFKRLGGVFVLKPGEQHKDMGSLSQVSSWLASAGADRSSVVLGIGGGVVSDIAGFAAASYMRGVRYATVATSLLGMIDAAIGGKTGVDLPEGKNLVGAFHHPVAVWCDPRFVTTLPSRHVANAAAEAIKYGVTLDPRILDLLLADGALIRSKDLGALERLIVACVKSKSRVIEEDPEERTGRRSVLNFGHTIGHALEVATGYSGLLHGEAVMIGMIVEAEIGARIGATTADVGERLAEHAALWSLPTCLPDRGLIEPMMTAMSRDKKALLGSLSMALPERVGACRLVSDVSVKLVREVLENS